MNGRGAAEPMAFEAAELDLHHIVACATMLLVLMSSAPVPPTMGACEEVIRLPLDRILGFAGNPGPMPGAYLLGVTIDADATLVFLAAVFANGEIVTYQCDAEQRR